MAVLGCGLVWVIWLAGWLLRSKWGSPTNLSEGLFEIQYSSQEATPPHPSFGSPGLGRPMLTES